MADFFRAIGIEINESTVKGEYYRAEKVVTNVTPQPKITQPAEIKISLPNENITTKERPRCKAYHRNLVALTNHTKKPVTSGLCQQCLRKENEKKKNVQIGGNGLDLRGSLGMGRPQDVPTKIADLLGAPGSVLVDLYEGGANIVKGNVWKGTERVMPRAVGTIMQGYRKYTEGLTTKTNTPMFFGREQIKENFLDFALKSLSFNPARIQKMKDIEWSEKEVWKDYRDRRVAIESKFLKFFLQPEGDRDKTKMVNLVDMVQDYNTRVKSHGLAGVEPMLTGDSLRTHLIRNLKPTEKEMVKDINRQQ